MNIKKLQQATDFYLIEIKHMKSKGWTEKAYVECYGTAEDPKIGDGGPAIWEADVNALFRARRHFLDVLQNYIFKTGNTTWRKQCPMAAQLFDSTTLGLPKAIDNIETMRVYTQRLIEAVKTSNS